MFFKLIYIERYIFCETYVAPGFQICNPPEMQTFRKVE